MTSHRGDITTHTAHSGALVALRSAWRLADGARFSPSSAAFTLYMVTTIEIYNVKLVSEAPISL